LLNRFRIVVVRSGLDRSPARAACRLAVAAGQVPPYAAGDGGAGDTPPIEPPARVGNAADHGEDAAGGGEGLAGAGRD
jgi:hypothetical protein